MNRFGIVSTDWMTNNVLSMPARALYAILATYCNKERSCYPSSTTLMKITGRSKATIYRLLNELESRAVIRRITEGHRRIIILQDEAGGAPLESSTT